MVLVYTPGTWNQLFNLCFMLSALVSDVLLIRVCLLMANVLLLAGVSGSGTGLGAGSHRALPPLPCCALTHTHTPARSQHHGLSPLAPVWVDWRHLD